MLCKWPRCILTFARTSGCELCIRYVSDYQAKMVHFVISCIITQPKSLEVLLSVVHTCRILTTHKVLQSVFRQVDCSAFEGQRKVLLSVGNVSQWHYAFWSLVREQSPFYIFENACRKHL